MEIDFSKGTYWTKVVSDNKITSSEIRRLARRGSGLSKEEAAKARIYLEALLDSSPDGYIDVKKIDVSVLDKIAQSDLDKKSKELDATDKTLPENISKDVLEKVVRSLSSMSGGLSKSIFEKLKLSSNFVSKGGSSDNSKIIQDQLNKIGESNSGEDSKDLTCQILSEEEFKEALFDMLKAKLKGRMTPEEEAPLKNSLYAYLETKLKGSSFELNTENLSKAYAWLLDFTEEIDVPDAEEAEGSEEFESVRTAAQGKFSTTCTLYAVISLIESCGEIKDFKSAFNQKSYGDLDLYTAQLIEAWGDYNTEDFGSFRSQGLTMEEANSIACEIGAKVGLKFEFKAEEISVNIENLIENHEEGVLVVINTEVGPHAIHVIKCEKGNVIYYDPIGKDGTYNIKMIPSEDFDNILIRGGGYISISK